MDTKELRSKAEKIVANHKDWTFDNVTVDSDGYVYVPECSYLSNSMICLTGTYEGSGDDCMFVQACSPQAIITLLDRLDELEHRLASLSK